MSAIEHCWIAADGGADFVNDVIMLLDEAIFTVAEVAERLHVNADTVRRIFLNEPGIIVICFPRKGRRIYRTVRIPEGVLRRVLTRLATAEGLSSSSR